MSSQQDTFAPPDFRLLFEESAHPYLVLLPDANYTIVAVNNRYLEATGTRRPEMLGRGLFEVFPDNPNDPSATGVSDLRSSLDRVRRDRVQDIMGVQKYDIPRRDGEAGFEVKYWSPVNTPVFGEAGAIAYIIHHVEDVTEFMLSQQRSSQEAAERIEQVQERADKMEALVMRRAAEVKDSNRQLKATLEELERNKAELTRLNEKLHDLDRAKTAFFSNVSHEFRTPLMLMLGPLEEVRDDACLAPELRERLDIAHRNSLRLFKLVNALLDFSRLEAGRIQARYEPVDLAALTAELASMFHSAIDSAGLELVVDCPPVPEPVYVDREMWEKIVLNLLSNAFKFTERGRIAVRQRPVDGRVELAVEDTGSGIPQDQLGHVFERFYRIEGTRGRTYEGTGIGLALVQELARLHGGAARVQSVQGHGSTFTVAIPLGKAHLPQERIRAANTNAATTNRTEAFAQEALSWLPDRAPALTEAPPVAEGPRPRVLLADDNADMRAYMGKILAGRYEVTAVADGEAALAAARERAPDLILSDVMMPRLDGFGLLRELRANPATQTIPFILLSARAGEEPRVEGLDAGADDYLVKPFSGRELLARMRSNLELARVRREATRREQEALDAIKLAQGLRAANTALAEADKRKDEFLAMLAHERRNPLAPVRNAVQVLRLVGAQEPVLMRQREIIDRQVTHMARLVDDLLDVSRMTRGLIELKTKAVLLADVLEQAVEMVTPLVQARHHTLSLALPAETIQLDADPERLVQIVGNLLANAVKFTDAGGRIWLTAGREGTDVVIRVRDNGAGIAPEILPHIFDIFTQADQGLARTKGGLGIGLTMVKRLVEMHGGTVEARSAGVSQGSEFIVRLPALPATAPVSPREENLRENHPNRP